jgi:hypothetical protein
MALRRGGVFAVGEHADLEPYAARADVRHAQAALHAIGKRERTKELHGGVYGEKGRLAPRDVQQSLAYEECIDRRIEERVVHRVVHVVVEVVVHPARGDLHEPRILIPPVGFLSCHIESFTWMGAVARGRSASRRRS